MSVRSSMASVLSHDLSSTIGPYSVRTRVGTCPYSVVLPRGVSVLARALRGARYDRIALTPRQILCLPSSLRGKVIAFKKSVL